GPSVFHSICLVVFGMLLGQIVTREANWKTYLIVAGFVVSSASYLAFRVSIDGIFYVAERIADTSGWRSHNEIGYYAFGVVVSTAMLIVARVVSGLGPPRLKSKLSEIGSVTLVYYVAGNAVLIAVPDITVSEWYIAIPL